MNRELVASLALFKTLYKSKKGNVLSIIALYIVSLMRKYKEKGLFQDKELKDLLQENYQINIPSAVIQKTCTDNQTIFRWTSKGYTLQNNFQVAEVDDFEKDIEDSSEKCEKLIADFHTYVAKERKCSVDDLEDKKILKDAFLDYIKDKDVLDIESPTCKLISQYIIEHDDDIEFIGLLDSIREGLVIYDGMRYADPSNERIWKTETTFILDVQYLFSSFGFNSSYHKGCFDDFYQLVKFINDGVPYKAGRNKRISLRYFPETKTAIENFFRAAEKIKLGEFRLELDNEAMAKIVNKCNDEYDVKLLKHKFWDSIKSKGITECDAPDIFQNKDYLFETEDLDKLVNDEFPIDEREQARDLFRFADYINILRKGKTVPKWEDCGYVFLSDCNLTNKVSRFLKRNDRQAITPVFQKMEWFTQKLWFASKQPVVDDKNLSSFSVLNRAKNIVSSLCKESVAKAYKEYLSENCSNGVLEEFYQELRNEDYSFESVNKTSVRKKICLSEHDAMQVFLDAKKRQEEEKRLREEKISHLLSQLEMERADNTTKSVFEKKYGLWFDHYLEVTIFVGAIFVLIAALVISFKFNLLGVILLVLSSIIIASNWIPFVTSFRNNYRQKLYVKFKDSLRNADKK